MNTRRISLLFLICLCVASAACRTAPAGAAQPVPLATGAAVCEAEPEICARLCARCPDREGCLARGGECALAAVSFNDTGDVNADVFTPGCHWEYTDANCTQGQQFFSVDECGSDPKVLYEWTLSACHGPTGDTATYDCDVECRRVGRGGGRCAWKDAVCAGRRSAYCQCDVPPPPPDNPTVAAKTP